MTSSVVGLTPRAAPLAPVRDAALFEAVVKQAFATRRKMLRGALFAQFGDGAVAAAFAASGVAGTKRAEELSVADFARLANALAEARPARVGDGRRRMPELPEVETIVRGLAPRLRGRRIASVWWSGQPLHLRRKVDCPACAPSPSVTRSRASAIGKFMPSRRARHWTEPSGSRVRPSRPSLDATRAAGW